ncbi:hypothetical protein CMUS01_12579 [Colletotrichum musicola]|uniref:Ankyrin repeat protein n=1 Tax=Colletotrichum musicola TaxID=2175873 RepID=A0A8H6JKD6_9PEZI|nr:hypothetical protein CMUS01_12579 [Colletotrichum musicola]
MSGHSRPTRKRTGANANNRFNGKTALHRAFSLPIASPQDSEDRDVDNSVGSRCRFRVFYERVDDPDLSEDIHATVRQDNALLIILSLLLNGADPEAEDDEKRTPVWYAKRNGWLDLDLPKAAAIRDMIECRRKVDGFGKLECSPGPSSKVTVPGISNDDDDDDDDDDDNNG